ncbi:uroporphyrinogen-III synthase [Legionella impletisoli]|uniref:Uroporphyrinogen-III synthase n=1 Tax=Legionella impletisoli TaxID=343510 RepID=A0A917NCQ5_9GAMM|nr:uroporphyrinogen-III synthase [Legionella impletisoli]GGI89208.1 uroporphyrinogen III methyltransferase [Legionella impletisoli]
MNELNPLRILNTRPEGQNAELTQLIQSLGFLSIELPAIAIKPINNWLNKLPPLSSIDYCIFVSANASNFFFEYLEKKHIRWPATIQIFAIGKATANALKEKGNLVTAVPNPENSEALLKLPPLVEVKDKTILQIKGEGGLASIHDTLTARGARLIQINVYQRVLPNYSSSQINSLWHEDAVDIILFTSQEAIQNLFTFFGQEGQVWLKEKPCIVISERIAATAKALGIKTIITCSNATLANTLKALKNTQMNGLSADNPKHS